jgi:hypothetical protein
MSGWMDYLEFSDIVRKNLDKAGIYSIDELMTLDPESREVRNIGRFEIPRVQEKIRQEGVC